MHPISLFLRGMLMGIADIVPGVSGGTIAFISGIYQRLITAISALTLLLRPYIWKRLLRGPFKPTIRTLHIPFLLNLGSGIVVGILIFARVMQFLINNYPVPTWAFFLSLIFLSALSIFQGIKKNLTTGTLLFMGIYLGYLIISGTPNADNTAATNLPYIFLCGFVAISAMLLPGISGSFILLLLGQYANILAALNSFNLPVIITFMAGCGLGIISIAKVISWLLRKFEQQMLAFLCGIMLSSLVKLWPWKIQTQLLISPTNILTSWAFKIGKNEIGVLPQNYEQISGNSAQISAAVFALLLALMLSLFLSHLRRKMT